MRVCALGRGHAVCTHSLLGLRREGYGRGAGADAGVGADAHRRQLITRPPLLLRLLRHRLLLLRHPLHHRRRRRHAPTLRGHRECCLLGGLQPDRSLHATDSLGKQAAPRPLGERRKLDVAHLAGGSRPLSPAAVVGGAVGGSGRRGRRWLRQEVAAISVVMGCGNGLCS
eukprot:scaffold88149_cov54-Phaeocystis_antarctica.AAC.4